MKYLLPLVLIILIGFFLYPAASSTVCQGTYKQYNVLDVLTGKTTDDLVDCINKAMETDENITPASSYSSSAGYPTPTSSEMISNKYVKPRLSHDGDR